MRGGRYQIWSGRDLIQVYDDLDAAKQHARRAYESDPDVVLWRIDTKPAARGQHSIIDPKQVEFRPQRLVSRGGRWTSNLAKGERRSERKRATR